MGLEPDVFQPLVVCFAILENIRNFVSEKYIK